MLLKVVTPPRSNPACCTAQLPPPDPADSWPAPPPPPAPGAPGIHVDPAGPPPPPRPAAPAAAAVANATAGGANSSLCGSMHGKIDPKAQMEQVQKRPPRNAPYSTAFGLRQHGLAQTCAVCGAGAAAVEGRHPRRRRQQMGRLHRAGRLHGPDLPRHRSGSSNTTRETPVEKRSSLHCLLEHYPLLSNRVEQPLSIARHCATRPAHGGFSNPLLDPQPERHASLA